MSCYSNVRRKVIEAELFTKSRLAIVILSCWQMEELNEELPAYERWTEPGDPGTVEVQVVTWGLRPVGKLGLIGGARTRVAWL